MKQTLKATANGKPPIEIVLDDAYTEQPVYNNYKPAESSSGDLVYVKALDALREGDLEPTRNMLEKAGYKVEISHES